MNDTSKASFLNLTSLEQTPVVETPFPYLVITDFIKPKYLPALIEAFPSFNGRGSIPAASVKAKPVFQQFIDELQGPELKQTIARKFAIDLENKPTMLTLRGYTNERDGHIHTDSKDKLMTLLLYINPNWDSETGKLRLLNSKNSLDDYAVEVSPLAGTCLIFKVTPNCWHGHKPFIGKRLSLQLNYVTDDTALSRHHNRHRLTAILKEKFPKLFGKKSNENY
jgi:SM-20-related protein